MSKVEQQMNVQDIKHICASAAKRNDVKELARLFKDSRCSQDVLNHMVPGTGMTMLGNALDRGNEAASRVIDLLLDQEEIDVDIFNVQTPNTKGDFQSFDIRSPLHCAIECGHLEYVKRICEKKTGNIIARLTTRHSYNYVTPFLNAVKCGKVKIYKYLLEFGVTHGLNLALDVMPDNTPSGEKNALEIAVRKGYLRTSKFLLDQHAWEYLRKADHVACCNINSAAHPMRVALNLEHTKLTRLLQKYGSPLPPNLPNTVKINKFRKGFRWQIPQQVDTKTLGKRKGWDREFCPICQTNVDNNRSFCQLVGCECKQTETRAMYHVGCITKWLYQKGSICPMCNKHYKQFNVLKT